MPTKRTLNELLAIEVCNEGSTTCMYVEYNSKWVYCKF